MRTWQMLRGYLGVSLAMFERTGRVRKWTERSEEEDKDGSYLAAAFWTRRVSDCAEERALV